MKKFNVKTLYAYKFISGCLPIYAFYTILFIERGQSETRIALLLAIWSVFTILFEVPSGILADRWNRRNMLAIASALQGICFFIWLFSHTFLMFTAGFIVWALACAFSSGTEESLIYDNLKSDGNEEGFTKIYGKAKLFGNIGTFTGIASGGIIASFIDIEAIALISVIICFANVVFAMLIREKNFYYERLSRENGIEAPTDASIDAIPGEEKTTLLETLKEAGVFIKGSRVALASIIFLVLFASLGGYLDEFDPLIINDFGLAYIWVSVILVVRTAFVALGDVLAPIVGKKVKSLRHIFMLNVVASLLLLAFAGTWNQYLIPIFGICFLIMAISEILLVNILQNEIKEEGRATVMSFYGIGENAAMICLTLIYALLVGIFPLQYFYIIISVYGILGGLSFYLIATRARKNPV